jgi:hypothetical protein
MKQIVRLAVVGAIAAFVLSPVVCLMPSSLDMAFADKDADKGKSEKGKDKDDDDDDKGEKDDDDDKKGGKGAPSAPELPGLLMIAGAAVVGGGFLLRKRLAGCPQKH